MERAEFGGARAAQRERRGGARHRLSFQSMASGNFICEC